MAIAIDSSSPASVSQTNGATSALTTASFSPPANSVILVCWQGNSQVGAPTAATISNTGGLTFTPSNMRAKPDTSADGQAGIWFATVTAAPGSMTVTVNNNASSGNRHARLTVLVLTGTDQDPGNWPKGEGSDSTGALDSLSYTSSAANSMGFASVSDWSASSATFTAAAGTTVVDGLQVASSINCATLRQTTPTTSGSTITLGLTAPTSTAWNYVWTEAREGTTPDPVPRSPIVAPGLAALQRASW